ncbi:MAG: hypothetical protein ACSLFF_06420 [Solirubrobacterales bacterium]
MTAPAFKVSASEFRESACCVLVFGQAALVVVGERGGFTSCVGEGCEQAIWWASPKIVPAERRKSASVDSALVSLNANVPPDTSTPLELVKPRTLTLPLRCFTVDGAPAPTQAQSRLPGSWSPSQLAA